MYRGMLLGALLFALAAGAGAAADTDTEALPRWGIGWLGQSQAPTFRVRLGQ